LLAAAGGNALSYKRGRGQRPQLQLHFRENRVVIA
jgi:hypothetical protein